MRLDRNDEHLVQVVLSARNLRSLLAKVNREDSAKVIMLNDAKGVVLAIHVETDEVHYAHREPGPVLEDFA